MPSTAFRASRAISLALSVLTVVTACGGGGNNGGTGPGTNPGGGNPGAIAVAAAPTTLSVVRGASGTLTVTIARSGTFSGPVTLAATGLPAGVTASFNPAQIPAGQTTSVLTLTTAASAATATSTITVVAIGSGVTDQTTSVQLTVTAPAQAGPFTISLSVSSYLALPPTNIQALPVITITRNPGFTGPVALTVTGAPAALVAAVTPSTVTGNTASLAILNGGVANGTYTITIRGVAAGLGEQSITLPVTVASPTTGSINWQFCDNGARSPQYFVAVKDGTGPWTRIVPNWQRYSFNVGSSTGAVALVTLDSGGYRTTVYHATAQELAARAASECTLYSGVSTRTATGTVNGLTSTVQALVAMGWWFSSAANVFGSSANYTLLNLPPGPLDLVAFLSGVTVAGDPFASRAIIRRGLNPASGGANAPLDLTSSESVALTSSTWTFGNTNGEGFSVSQHLTTAGGTTGLFTPWPSIDRTSTTRSVQGIPVAQTIAGDLHQVVATVSTNTSPVRATRQIIAYARTIADRSINFGPVMPAPSITIVPGAPAGRLRATGVLPTEYNSGVSLDVTQTSTARFATVQATRGFLGAGTTYDIQMSDLSAAIGWDTNFALRAGAPAQWWVSGGGPTLDAFDVRYVFSNTRARWTGALAGITAPADGAVYLMGRASGTITP
jgi:hypothetical protein